MTANPPEAPRPPDIDRTLSAILEEARHIRTESGAETDARRKATRGVLAGVCVLVVFVGMLIAQAWQTNNVVHSVNETNMRMADCTTPGGRCYEQNRKVTGNAISDVIRAEIFMSQCARLFPGEFGPSYDRKLERCVGERLAAVAENRADPSTPPHVPAPLAPSRSPSPSASS